MLRSQEKILEQKVNVKFFTVDPYSVGTGVPRPFSKFANYWKNIFLKIKTSKIKSEKNIYQTIHNTRFILNFFGIFTIFLYFSRFFEKKIMFFGNIPKNTHCLVLIILRPSRKFKRLFLRKFSFFSKKIEQLFFCDFFKFFRSNSFRSS